MNFDHPDDCQHYWCQNPRHIMKGVRKMTMRERKQLEGEQLEGGSDDEA